MQFKKKNLFFEVTIPGRVGIKKNNRQVFKSQYGKTQNLPSDRFKNWEKIATAYIAQAKVKQKLKRTYELNIEAYFEFHFKNHRALPDTSNCIEGPQDVMQDMGIFQNDKQITLLKAHRKVSGEEKTIVKLYKGEM